MAKGTDLQFHTSSFSSRILLALFPFVLIIVFFYSLSMKLAIQETEDRVVGNYLLGEAKVVCRQLESGNTAAVKLPTTSYMQAFWHNDPDLPQQYRALQSGIHEVDEDSSHVLVAHFENKNRRFYLILDEQRFSALDNYVHLMELFIVIAGLIVIVAGCVLAVFIARWLAFPLTQLADEISIADVPGGHISGTQRNDEIGVLSRSFQALLDRLKTMLARESAFTRHVSHELRTPVAVTTNALHVLQLEDIGDDKRQRNMERIAAANQDIQQLLEVFLCLGREDTAGDKAPVSVPQVVEVELERLRARLDNHGFIVEQHILDELYWQASPQMLNVLLANLLRNALDHGKNKLIIDANESALICKNNLCDSELDGKGYGFGLEIIERICEHQGWKSSIDRSEDTFQVTITHTA